MNFINLSLTKFSQSFQRHSLPTEPLFDTPKFTKECLGAAKLSYCDQKAKGQFKSSRGLVKFNLWLGE